jgi:hypothetical protein
LPDDLGGHCNDLGAAFNPTTNFVCCRENPATVQEDPVSAPDAPAAEDDSDAFVQADKMGDAPEVKLGAVTEIPCNAQKNKEL